MTRGYDQPLYLLPFDHRHSYETGVFGFEPPLTGAQHLAVVGSKRLIYDGFLRSLGQVRAACAAILVDEEFGAEILRDARAAGHVTALATEKSGCDEFVFEYGEAFAEHIDAFRPTFAKVLVRYNPEGDPDLNRRQAERLERVSAFCRAGGPHFMFELLVPATASQLARVRGDATAFDLELRPTLMVQAIRALQDAGVEPDVWKVEGLDRREDCQKIVDTARRDGRAEVGCIVLGRGADQAKVVRWLEIASSVPGFIGFAVGRTTFEDAVADFLAGRASRSEAVAQIARRYGEWAAIFQCSQPPGEPAP